MVQKKIIGPPMDKTRFKKIESPFNNLVEVNGELIYLTGVLNMINTCEAFFTGIVAATGEPVRCFAWVDIDEYGETEGFLIDFFEEYKRSLLPLSNIPDTFRHLDIVGDRKITKKQLAILQGK